MSLSSRALQYDGPTCAFALQADKADVHAALELKVHYAPSLHLSIISHGLGCCLNHSCAHAPMHSFTFSFSYQTFSALLPA